MKQLIALGLIVLLPVTVLGQQRQVTVRGESVTTTMQNAATANGNGTVLTVDGLGTATLTVNCSSCSGGTTVNFEAQNDGTNFTPILATTAGTTTTSTTTATAGLTYWAISVAGYKQLRARISAYSAGTVTVVGTAVPVGGGGGAGGGVAGTVTATQTTGSNLHMVVDSGTISTITNTVTVSGSVTSTVSQSTASNLNATVVQGTAANLKVEAVGTLTDDNAAPAATNIGALTVLANAAQPTSTEGRQTLLSSDLRGRLRGIVCDAALNDRCADVSTVGSNNYLLTVGPPITYNSTQPSLSNGQTADFQITTRAALIVNAGVEGFIPGTGATALGKAIDTATGSTDTGVLALVTRDDALATLTPADGDNVQLRTDALGALWSRHLDPCSGVAKSYFVVNLSTSGTTEIANSVASQYFYICSVNLVTTAANKVLIAEDDTDGCGSISAGLNGGTTSATGWNFSANGGIALGNGDSSVMRTGTTQRYLCIAMDTSTQLSGTITYVSAP